MTTSRRLSTTFAWVGQRALDILLPPQCISCGTSIEATGALCASCWSAVTWIAPPFCDCCGLPFDFDPGVTSRQELWCAACIADRPEFARARAAFRYDDLSKRMILALKHADRTHGAPAFGHWLARAGRDLLAETDLIAPVPMHWTRLAWRRYNQSALLALAVARIAGRRCLPDLLVRQRRTPPQGELGRRARWRNVRGAFAVDPRHVAKLAGTRVLLVDDVMTTGATVRHCARALRAAGAASVDVLTLARVVLPGRDG